jgi:hypothetical protein
MFRLIVCALILAGGAACTHPTPHSGTASAQGAPRYVAPGGRFSLRIPPGYSLGHSVFPDIVVLESSSDASEQNTCPSCIMVTFYDTQANDATGACYGEAINPTLQGAVYAVTIPLNGPSALVGVGEGVEACLTDGHSSALVTMQPPGDRVDSAFKSVVQSLRFE